MRSGKWFIRGSFATIVMVVLALSASMNPSVQAAQTTAATTAVNIVPGRFPACPPGVRPTPTGTPAANATRTPRTPQPRPTVFVGIAVLNVARCGARVVTVRRNSPAAAAQLQVGDVIVAVNNQQIVNSVELFAALIGHNPGDVVTFTVDRRIRRVIPRRNATATPEVNQQPQIAPGVVELDIQITLGAIPTPQPRTGAKTSTPVATAAR